MTVFWATLNTVGFLIGILSWFGVTPNILLRYARKNSHKVFNSANFLLVIACLLTFNMVRQFFYLPIARQYFTAGDTVFMAAAVIAVSGAWRLVLIMQGYWNRKVSRLGEILLATAFAYHIVGVWFVFWPNWQLPAFYNVTFIFLVGGAIYLSRWLTKRFEGRQ